MLTEKNDDPQTWRRKCDLCGVMGLFVRMPVVLWVLTEDGEWTFVRLCETCADGIPECELND